MESDAAAFDLNLLRVLLALDRTRHVTHAAELLNMSQSGFSSALARLRGQCGDALFVRTSSGMTPTPHARRMADAAAIALAAFEDYVFKQPLFDPASSRSEVSLAMTDLAEIVFLPRLLHRFQRIAPHLSVRSGSFSEEPLRQALGNGRVDLAIGYFPELISDVFLRQRLYLHTFACVARRSHPAVRGSMSAAEFLRLGHVVVTSPSRAGHLLESRLQRRGIERRIVLRAPHYLSLLAIVESTDLVATVPLAVAVWFEKHGAVQLLPLPFSPGLFEVQQHWHRRYQDDGRHRWLRQQVSTLFNDASDSWRSVEQKLYGSTLRRCKA